MRTISIDGTSAVIRSAMSTSRRLGAPKVVPSGACAVIAATTAGCAWPSSSGPQEPMQSMYSWPSASQTRAPSAALDEARLATDGAERAHGRVHAAGDERLRPLEERAARGRRYLRR